MNLRTDSAAGALLAVGLGVVLMLALPVLLDDFALMQATVYVVMALLALSLGFVWGHGGILSLGQSAFFGLGAYTYAVAALNLEGSLLPVLLAVVVPAAAAALLGYVMFYGRLSDVYVGVITLTATLILFNLANSTAGPQWRIGDAALGGFNGMPALPPLHTSPDPDDAISPRGLFQLSLALLVAAYAGLRLLLASTTGRVVVAARHNELRALLLGYDARACKLLTFAIGGAIAGLSGCLFANWSAFTSPTVFSLAQSAQVIVWVIVGGLGTLVGPVVGCVLVQWLTTWVGTQPALNANLALGAVLLGVVLLMPAGIVPTLGALAGRWQARRRPPVAVGEELPT